MKQPAVYIMANRKNGTLYVGVTSGIYLRIYQHKKGEGCSFTKRYGCNKLVYYELYPSMIEAIAREKQIKAGSRQKKIELIRTVNPEWLDLYEKLNN